MENSDSEIVMWRKNGRSRVTILKRDYEAVSYFIFSLLQKKQTIEIQQLIEEAKVTLAPVLGRDYSWCLLRVKYDLEAKGLIRVTVQPNRTQLIKATRKGLGIGVSVL